MDNSKFIKLNEECSLGGVFKRVFNFFIFCSYFTKENKFVDGYIDSCWSTFLKNLIFDSCLKKDDIRLDDIKEYLCQIFMFNNVFDLNDFSFPKKCYTYCIFRKLKPVLLVLHSFHVSKFYK